VLLPQREAEQRQSAEYGEGEKQALPQAHGFVGRGGVGAKISRSKAARNRSKAIFAISPHCLHRLCAIGV
jgi:hypothetical protein